MDLQSLPTTHVLTKEEQEFVAKLDQKSKELHAIAVQWLQTSYRPEWSHMWTKGQKH